jgi:hypothetical protein
LWIVLRHGAYHLEQPPQPSSSSHATPATEGGLPTSDQMPIYLDRGPAREQHEMAAEGQAVHLPDHMPDPHWDTDINQEITCMQSAYSIKLNESHLQAANRQLNLACKHAIPPSGPEIPQGEEMTPYISSMTAIPVPMALVSRPPYGPPNMHNDYLLQNEAWLSCIRNSMLCLTVRKFVGSGGRALSGIGIRRGLGLLRRMGFGGMGMEIPGLGIWETPGKLRGFLKGWVGC